MREITSHVVNPKNDQLRIFVRDEPGPGGAHHEYEITLPNGISVDLKFQKGGIAESGVNGITHEALLAVLIDRLQCFQRGPYPSEENWHALRALEAATDWLAVRTRARMERGVEGKAVA